MPNGLGLLLDNRDLAVLRLIAQRAANVTKRLWKIGDIVDVLEAWEASNSKNIVS